MSDTAPRSGSPTPREFDPPASIPNPLRATGFARIVAGGWFIASGAGTLREYDYLLPQIRRLFAGEMGGTDVPVRSLLTLVTAVLLVLLGLRLLLVGFRWTQRLRLPTDGPAPVERGDVVAALRHQRLPAYAAGLTEPDFPLRRWLTDELAGMTRWRRDLIGRGARLALRACVFASVVAVVCLVIDTLRPSNVLGPFPTSFVVVLPFVSVVWVILALSVITTERLRAESMGLPLAVRAEALRGDAEALILENRPRLLDHTGGWINLLGLSGVAVQCLTIVWWKLSPIGYPLLTTSIIRHMGAIAGGVLFFLLGRWMVNAASNLSQAFRYDSIVVLVDGVEDEMSAHAAAIRTEARSLTGTRRVIAAVGAAYVREPALALLAVEERAYLNQDATRWQRPTPSRMLADMEEEA